MDKSDTPRIWICPVSGAHFQVEEDESDAEIKVDLWGRPMKSYKVTPLGEE